MRKLFLCIVLVATAGSASATTNYQDWWWNPAQSGMGLNIGQQGNTIFISWFLYDSSGNSSFLTMSGTLTNNTVQGSLFRTTGPLPGPSFDPNAVTTTAVGSATMTFTSDTRATFDYSFDGLSGTLNLERFSFATIDLSGSYQYASAGTVSDCIFPQNNGAYLTGGTLSINQIGTSVTATTVNLDGETCDFNLTLRQEGSTYEADGTFSCDIGISGTVSMDNVRLIDDFLTLDYDAVSNTGETCRDQSQIAAVD